MALIPLRGGLDSRAKLNEARAKLNESVRGVVIPEVNSTSCNIFDYGVEFWFPAYKQYSGLNMRKSIVGFETMFGSVNFEGFIMAENRWRRQNIIFSLESIVCPAHLHCRIYNTRKRT